MDIYTEAIQKLYVAYFSRPADAGGLGFWRNAIVTANGDITAVAAAFATSQEYRDTYGGKTSSAVINAIYQNLFNRDAEPAALDFWGGALDGGAMTVDDAVLEISGAARNGDAVTFANKVAAADDFSTALDTPAKMGGYSGVRANQVAKTWLAGITNTDSLATATEPATLTKTVETVVQAGSAAPVLEALTTGRDLLAGTSGDDQFIASVDAVAGSAWHTLGPDDIVDGDGGNDTLTVGVFTRLDDALLKGVRNIEILQLEGSAEVELNSATVTGLRLIDASAMSGRLSVTAGAGVTVKGGAADDVLRALGTGTVVLGGGEGRDVFDLSGFKAAGSAIAAVITDLAAGERIVFAGAASAFVAGKIQLAAGASLDSYANAAASAAHAASASGALAWFQHGGDSFIVQDVNGNGSFDGGADILVKLTGLRDLENALLDPAQPGSLVLA